jgi:hypothetical protein
MLYQQAVCCVVVAKSRIMFDQSNIPPREKRQFACEIFFTEGCGSGNLPPRP